MNATEFYVRYNAITVSSIASFAGVTGRVNGGCKDVYFWRMIGCNASYLEDIEKMDALLRERQGRGHGAYLRLGELPRLCRAEDISAFSSAYDEWRENPNQVPAPAVFLQNTALGEALALALCKVREVFCLHSPGVTDSMGKNFVVKLLFWASQLLDSLLLRWDAGACGKFIYTGEVKKTEYLFCYLLTLLGMDVLILSPRGPVDLEAALLKLSGVVHLGAAEAVAIPAYAANPLPPKSEAKAAPAAPAAAPVPTPVGAGQRPAIAVASIRRPDRERTAAPAVPPAATPPRSATIAVPPRAATGAMPPRVAPAAVPAHRQELEFEQLALLASSIVMIEVHDAAGQVISSGSGIMVGEGGYILTNHHVACKGNGFLVHIEEDETVYHTNEVIKTHALLDLALIRIQRTLRCIPVYQQGAPIVRGQKVVAIGSPLGLFNSVSNGIISGFRTIGEVEMIQFTAPTSPGSSGGAVLNMFGEVIGISTAGMDRGQNLNLAVGYQSILPFIRGFIK